MGKKETGKKPAATATPKAEPQDVLAVALSSMDDTRFNRLTLSWSDLVMPLEKDTEDDHQDDEVLVQSIDGMFESGVLRSKAELDEPNKVLYYRLPNVKYGAYQVAVKVAGHPSTLIGNLVYRKAGAFVGEDPLPEAKPSIAAAPAPQESGPVLEPPKPDPNAPPDFPDQVE